MTLRQLRVWDQHRAEILAGEQLDAVRAQSLPWMEPQARAGAVAELIRRADGDFRAADAGDDTPHDGFDRVTLEQFRRDIGAARKS